MSLQQAANYLASQGRGGDSMLVHMAPSEVRSLQAVAMAHGGSLSVNPQTGLPEAGFLSKILPAVIGVGLTAATGGAAAPWMIGLGVGGLETMRTGSLGKGLMAGLGAYGGAGLGAGLMGAGTSAATSSQLAAGSNAKDILLARSVEPATSTLASGLQAAASNPMSLVNAMGGPKAAAQYGLAGAAPMLMGGEAQGVAQPPKVQPTQPLRFDPGVTTPFPMPDTPGYGNQGQNFGREQQYYNSRFVPLAEGGPVGAMSESNAMGTASGYPMANIAQGGYSTPFQQPQARTVVSGPQDAGVNIFTGEQVMAGGGEVSHLGDYSDGGRLLKGPGDGVSDSIPAMIGKKQPARLADGEFVVPARIVSELGNGSTEAGARKLYAMMDRVQQARGKTTGKDRVAVNSRADKYLPA